MQSEFQNGILSLFKLNQHVSLPFGNFTMQLFFTCQCGKQIEIPARSAAKQTSSFLRCNACGVLYPTPQEILTRESLPGKSLPGESLPRENRNRETRTRVTARRVTARRETLSRGETLSREQNDPESEFAALGLKPDWTVYNGAGDKLRRKKTSTLRKIVPPVLGGLAALPIATAIMWYGFGRDVGTTARFVSNYVPWIVPQKLRLNPGLESISKKKADIPGLQRETLPALNQNDSTSTPPEITEDPGVAADTYQASSESSLADLPSVTPSINLQRPKNGSFATTQAPGNQATLFPQIPVTWSDKMEVSDNAEAYVEKDNRNYQSPRSLESREALTLSISETISMLRMLKNDLYEAPKEMKISLIGDYYKVAKILSEQSASLRGRSAVIWREAIEKLAVEILKDNNSKTVMKYGPIGKIPGISISTADDFVVTVLTISKEDEPDSKKLCTLNEPWILGEENVPVEILPGAWRKGTQALPTTCLIFGRLTDGGSSNADSSTYKRGKLTLQVHMALPE